MKAEPLLTCRDIRAGLARTTPLNRQQAASGIACKLCGQATRYFDLVDANKCASEHDCYVFGLSGVGVVYVRCENCGFVFTSDFDDWTGADFSRYIYNDDYVKVDPDYVQLRPARLAAKFAAVLQDFKYASLLDYGSGAGVFVRNMRDQGFNSAQSYDPFSNPVRPTSHSAIVTCFEVVEHAPDPISTLRDIGFCLAPNGVALIETSLMPANIGAIRGSWWYIAPRNGHVSIFCRHALKAAADAAGLVLKLGVDDTLLLHHRDHRPDANLLGALGGRTIRDFLSVRLSAPGPITQNAGRPACNTENAWNSLEQLDDGRSFRWSRLPTLAWDYPAAGQLVQLEIEIETVGAITPQFRQAMKLQVCGQATPLEDVGGGKLRASLLVRPQGGLIRCIMQTPSPRTPISLGLNDDTRPLGVAIRADE